MIAEFPSNGEAIDAISVWRAPGVTDPRSVLQLSAFPWSVGQLRQGKLVRFSRLDGLPSNAAVDRATYARLSIGSAIGVPLAVGSTVMGMLVLSVQDREQAWADDVVQRLEFIAGIFASALLRRRSAVELERLRGDLMHVGRVASMGELAASIAHELNQPLTAILSSAQVAERLIDSGTDKWKDLQEILADIVDDDKRAGDVIRRLRAFVKKDTVHYCRVDVNAVIEDVVRLVHSDAIIRCVSIDMNLTRDLPPVLADQVQLQQVVLNLIMNGFDAMSATRDRHLVITSRGDANGTVFVSVSDSGSGISEPDLPRIFEPFYTTKPQGLGMGLSISRSLIEAQGGQLRAENNTGAGVTLTFSLPAAPEHTG